jgi:lactaldehyde reductase
MHHGTANAVCLPTVMEFNAQRKPGLYRRVGIAAGLDVLKAGDPEADRRTIAFLRGLIREVGLGDGLGAFGVKVSDLDALSEQAFDDACHQTNPVPVTRADLRALYEAAM